MPWPRTRVIPCIEMTKTCLGLTAIAVLTAACGSHDPAPVVAAPVAPVPADAAMAPEVYEVPIEPVVDAPPTARRVARAAVSEKQAFDDTSLTADQVLQTFQTSYLAAVLTCYQAALDVDPTARGKLKLTIRVGPDGRASRVKADTFDDAIGACVETAAHGWTFAKPRDKHGKATEAEFALVLQLVPQ
jgi:hypothetical protein